MSAEVRFYIEFIRELQGPVIVMAGSQEIHHADASKESNMKLVEGRKHTH